MERGYQINKKKRIGNFYKSDALLYLIYESTVNDKTDCQL